MAYYHGDKDRLKTVRRYREERRLNGGVPSVDIFEFSRQEYMDYVIRKSVNSYFKKSNDSGDATVHPLEMHFGDDVFKMGSIGSFMVTTLLKLMASDEQRNAWLPLITNNLIISSYA